MYTLPLDNTKEEYFDMKKIGRVDAEFVRRWQVGWLKDHPFAAPHEIAEATNKAIIDGQITLNGKD